MKRFIWRCREDIRSQGLSYNCKKRSMVSDDRLFCGKSTSRRACYRQAFAEYLVRTAVGFTGISSSSSTWMITSSAFLGRSSPSKVTNRKPAEDLSPRRRQASAMVPRDRSDPRPWKPSPVALTVLLHRQDAPTSRRSHAESTSDDPYDTGRTVALRRNRQPRKRQSLSTQSRNNHVRGRDDSTGCGFCSKPTSQV